VGEQADLASSSLTGRLEPAHDVARERVEIVLEPYQSNCVSDPHETEQ